MRRLLTAFLAAALLLALAAPALGADRVPPRVKRVSIVLVDPLKEPGAVRPAHRTLTRASTVARVVRATDALRAPRFHGVCPMLIRLGPELTVTFRSASGSVLAQARVEVTAGDRGTSGSTPCFPIRFTSRGRGTALLGNSWVRMMGRLLGRSIS